MSTSSPNRREQQRQQQDAFTKALREHKSVRIAWLASLRAFLVHTVPNIPVEPGDEAELLEVDKRLPPDGGYRLDVVESSLRERVPEFTRLFRSEQLIGLFLVGAVARYMREPDLDPLAPWQRGGRPRNSGTFGSAEEFRRHGLMLIRQLISKRSPPTQEAVAELLGIDPKTLYRLCQRFHVRWADLVDEAHQKN